MGRPEEEIEDEGEKEKINFKRTFIRAAIFHK